MNRAINFIVCSQINTQRVFQRSNNIVCFHISRTCPRPLKISVSRKTGNQKSRVNYLFPNKYTVLFQRCDVQKTLHRRCECLVGKRSITFDLPYLNLRTFAKFWILFILRNIFLHLQKFIQTYFRKFLKS